jgi:hypothetical protein
MTEADRSRVMNAEYQLTHRQALILMALTLGTYNDASIGSTIGNDAGESTLLELGFIEEINGELAPTELGRATAQWMLGTILDVISPSLTSLLDA